MKNPEEVLTDMKYFFSVKLITSLKVMPAKRHETLIDDESNTSLSTYIKDNLEGNK
jgi:hypothetical protein